MHGKKRPKRPGSDTFTPNGKELSSIRAHFRKVQQNRGISAAELFEEIISEPRIPSSVFSGSLSGLEGIVKYLIEELGHSQKESAVMLGRSAKTVWQAYQSAKKKHPAKLKADSRHWFRISAIREGRLSKLSVLESVSVSLRDSYKLSISQIAMALNRDPRTIWTVLKRAERKNAK